MPGKSSRSAKITRLLIAWSEGRKDALDDLLPLVYEELRRCFSKPEIVGKVLSDR